MSRVACRAPWLTLQFLTGSFWLNLSSHIELLRRNSGFNGLEPYFEQEQLLSGILRQKHLKDPFHKMCHILSSVERTFLKEISADIFAGTLYMEGRNWVDNWVMWRR